jgi:hypothetical protein
MAVVDLKVLLRNLTPPQNEECQIHEIEVAGIKEENATYSLVTSVADS